MPRKASSTLVALFLALIFCAPLLAPTPAVKCPPAGVLARDASLHALAQRYKNFRQLGPKDNARFLDIAENSNDRGWLFLDVELSVLKELNDRVIGDKDVVTGLGNAYKEMFFGRLEKALALHPELAPLLQGKYSDFKSVRLAFDARKLDAGARGKLEGLLNEVYQGTAKEFGELVTKEPALRAALEEAHGIAKEPEWWHFGGMGHSADLAGVVGRDARSFFGKGAASLHTFEQRRVALDAKVKSAESLRGKMAGLAPRDSEITEKGRFGDEIILSVDAIDIFRKAKGDDRATYITNVMLTLQKRFNTKVSREFVEAAKDYMTEVDGFSPGVNSVERVIIDHGLATHGEVSVDFAGQGARNMRETMSDLAAAHKSGRGSEEAVRLARLGEQRATKEMGEMKDTFERVCKEVFGDQNGKYYFSGDDGIFMPTYNERQGVSPEEKLSLVRKFADSKFRGSYRLTFLPHDAPPQRRSKLIVQSETLEKDIRKKLEGKVPRDVLKRLLIAPEPVLIGNRVVMQVYLAGHSRAELDLRAKVRDAMNESLPEGTEAGALVSVYPEGNLISFPVLPFKAEANDPAKANRHGAAVFPRGNESKILRRGERRLVETRARAA